MKPGRWTYQRWLAVISYGAFLVVLLLVLSRLAVYFKSGADDFASWYTDSFSKHHPRISWVETSNAVPDSIQRYIIGRAYADAWHASNLYISSGISKGLSDYFADSQRAVIERYPHNEDVKTERVDMAHHLIPSLFSPDGQLIVFRDSSADIRSAITNEAGETILEHCSRDDYNVIMTLDDGRWRVRHMQRTATGKCTIKKDGQLNFEQGRTRIKGVNYYPSHSPWLKFWDGFNADTVARDLSRIRNSGFNLVRVFIPYEAFGAGIPHAARLDDLGVLLDMASDEGLMIIPTLFDFPGGYDLDMYTSTSRQLTAILDRYHSHPAVYAWDLKNEPDRDFELHGKDQVIRWLTTMLAIGRSHAPGQRFTVGWSTDAAAHLMQEDLDLVSFHYYEDPNQLPNRLARLVDLCGDKPLMLQETGLPTLNSPWLPGGRTQREQEAYLHNILTVLDTMGEVDYAVWSYYDFTEAPVAVFGWKPWQRIPQKYFGLYSINGEPKKAAGLFIEKPAADTKHERIVISRVKPFHITLLVFMLLLAGAGYWLRRIAARAA